MPTSEISATTPLPVFVTNSEQSSLPAAFTVGSRWAMTNTVSSQTYSNLTILEIFGAWVYCTYDGEGRTGLKAWLHLPSVQDCLWSPS